MKRLHISTPLILALVITACSATATSLPADPRPASGSTETSSALSDSATRTDEQGAIVIDVTPLNLEAPTDTLEFDVLMNTHSIDLTMDLAAISTLTTDTGITVQATLWEVPRGGHHVEGRLVFPMTNDGKSILEGASKLTLTILNVDASTRDFEWDLK